jgi:hypothetical protein
MLDSLVTVPKQLPENTDWNNLFDDTKQYLVHEPTPTTA